ncbi:TRAP transporter substrate-binding protein [Aromatoleum evansii]|uniref:TRAP transporter substrate-binding protein n=1 Tax=Aromatoleum evansii TaxID=59406 RepID=A0ABZ1AHV9_AROEV|nr:TRAP transporter substrate-binding protein [Aromatoleum evansii]NMG29800.1 DctP family TRAP transporter solute-binding subunit [Aromatoleum evansii]WRL44874.1 TRAP transporter substrate-binding protein [Aromatoleum evansii]
MLKKLLLSVAGAAALALTSLTAAAQDVSWRLAHVFPEQSSVGEAANMFAKLAAERSNGRIKIAVFPSGQLGGDEAIGRELVRGTIEMGFVNPNSMVGMDPLFDFHILPFIATSYADADRIYYGEDNILRQTLRETIERNRMKILGYFENDFRAISNSKRPVKTVDDLKGLKLRVVPSQSLKMFFEKAGSQVVIMPFPELFTALQQGTVDGQENGVILIKQARFYEAQKHVTLLNHSYVMSTITASQRALGKLSPADQELLQSIGKEVGEWQVKRNRANSKVALDELRKAGIEIHEPTAQEIAQFRALGEKVWAEMTPVYGEKRIAELRKLVAAK